jgi:hypothetical protein
VGAVQGWWYIESHCTRVLQYNHININFSPVELSKIILKAKKQVSQSDGRNFFKIYYV